MSVDEFVKKYAVDRYHTNSLKWDALDERFGNPDLTAMWVADMEFQEPQAVTDALIKRVQHGIYGYSLTPDSYFEAYAAWQKKRHNIDLKKEWLTFDNGVVGSLYTIVNTLTKPDDAILVLTPVYYPFHNAVNDNGRKLIKSELVRTDNHFEIDYDDVERKIVENDVKLFIQCSPHNPVGRIWTADELDRIMDICQRHGVLIVSDEIHQDIEIGERKFISALSIADGKYQDDLIVVTAPSKTFNMAGLLNSHVIIPNQKIQNQFLAGKKRFNEVDLSVLGQVAAEAAYRYGEEWLDGLLEVIRYNYDQVRVTLNREVPQIKVAELEGTYLLWLDLRDVMPADQIKDFIQNKVGIAVDYGEWFSDYGLGCVRLNLATDPKFVKAAVDRIVADLK